MWLFRTIVALRPVWSLKWDFRYEGETQAVPRTGPLLVVTNHACFLDPWFLRIVFPRDIHYLIIKSWYEKSRFWRWFFDGHGVIPTVDDAMGTIGRVSAALERGLCVGIFPEGKISHDGRMSRFRGGVALIAAMSGAPVLPVGIQGAYESLPRSRRWPKSGPITVKVGKPVVFPGAPHRGEIPKRKAVEFLKDLHRQVAVLAGQHPGVREEAAAEAGRATDAGALASDRG